MAMPTDDWQFDCRRSRAARAPLSSFALGSALALSDDGDTLAAGAHNEDGRGEVHVFVRASGTYSIQDSLVASNADSGDRFGAALALSARW
ncbi:MAG: hypothetical protein U5K33_06485 [Halofilum sp. (in: g-proteobacteria)]|nr:hypothetical protein [Halofilum sp. (in: g-proteobacteria)]